jgi:flagellar protein FliO/FliZ
MVCLLPLALAQSGETSGAGEPATAEPATTEDEAVDERSLTFGDDAGEDGDDVGAQPGSINSFGVWDFVRMVIVLGIVIAVIYVVFYLLKRASGGRFENSPMIRLLGSHGLPGNKALHLVEVGRQVFLIGVGDDSIALLSEISDQESLDELRLKASTTTTERGGNFADMLSGFFNGGERGSSASGGTGTRRDTGTSDADSGASHGRGSASGASSMGGGAPSSFFESQKERLRKLR